MKITGLGEKRIEELSSKGITSVMSLVSYFPSKYIDFQNISPIDVKSKQEQSVCAIATGEVQTLFLKQFSSIKVSMKDVSLNQNFLSVWYNQPYIKKRIQKDKEYLLFGKMSPTKFGEFVVKTIKDYDENLLKPLAVYKPIGSMKSAFFQTAVAEILKRADIYNTLSEADEQKFGLMSLGKAISSLHFPNSLTEIEPAKRRIQLENYLKLLACKEILNAKKKKHTKYVQYLSIFEEFKTQIAFNFSNEQQKAIKEICEDLQSEYQTNRLLEGDVGSGKTIVAFFTLFQCVRSGHQGVMLAPTEILAKQHYLRAKELFDKLNINVAYLSSKTSNKEKKEIKAKLASGEIKILIGTHSVLGDDIVFNDLSLAITDEQHRFGVEQRGKLSKKSNFIDTIVMSATPIPRSLSLVLFGDLNITTIKEKPFASSQRHTYLLDENKQTELWKFIEDKAKNGTKTFIVCPTIYDENMQNDITNIEKMVNLLQKNEYIANNLVILHGKMKKEEQDEAINSFAFGDKKVLLATTIIEVGIDIPSANILVITNPERFGLATLHQLRGRIGRGQEDGYCFCLKNKDMMDSATSRLQFFAKHNNGFEIAEFDAKNRGSGNIFGTKQHGKTELNFSFGFNIEEFEKAKEIYKELSLSNEKISTIYEQAKAEYSNILDKVILN